MVTRWLTLKKNNTRHQSLIMLKVQCLTHRFLLKYPTKHKIMNVILQYIDVVKMINEILS